jgi:nucleoside-diphosphate-sugar epimerase
VAPGDGFKFPMKVLLTGASGFVGSHILDLLIARDIPTAILLRSTSRRRFIEPLSSRIDVRIGSVSEPASLPAALEGITHVIHCAGCTKAIGSSEYYRINRDGTRNLVEAVNRRQGAVQQFILISSLAASHPARADTPAREDDESAPVTEYGRSKLAGERVLREHARIPYAILRPAAVYGPRDGDFLLMFKAARARWVPSFGAGRQQLSLVYVEDVARAVLACLERPAIENRIYNVAHAEVLTAHALTAEIGRQLGVNTIQIPLPTPLLWPVCLVGEAIARISGRPSIVNLQKYPELAAPGWVCDSRRLRDELGCEPTTGLKDGIARTLAWYRQQGWLR